MKKRVIFYFILVIFFIAFNFYLRPVEGNSLVDETYKKSDSYINDLYYSDEMFRNNLNKDGKKLYDNLVEASEKNTITIKMECDMECANSFNLAYSALYLDHPELLSFVGVDYCRYDDEILTCKNLSGIGSLRITLATNRIIREMDIIRKETKNMDEKEKIMYVYNYVASHDYNRIFMAAKSNQSAYSFFTGGKSVCAGFAKASQIIFQNIGINSMTVLDDEHMWNYVEYEGKYYVFDSTMGTGYVKNSEHYYDGLGKTTVGDTTGLFSDLYPEIEKTTLKEIFQV